MSEHVSHTEPNPELDRLAHRVIGAAIEVHRVLGPGFLESAYEAALCIELEERGIAFVQQAPVPITYKGRDIGSGRVDVLVADSLVVELKVVDALTPLHTAQVISYLKALRRPLGLLMNFNTPVLRTGIQRVVLSEWL